MMADDEDRVRVAINMSREDYEELKELAKNHGVSVTGYLKKAIATERYLKEKTVSGGRVLIEEDGVQKEIVFL
jgi:hypothetical protein